MTKNTTTSKPTNPSPTTSEPDLFGDFAAVAAAVEELIERTETNLEPATAASKVPACPEFTVADLLDHFLLVSGRIVIIGEGRHWTELMDHHVQAKTNGAGGWTEGFRADRSRFPELWLNPEVLGRTFEVPWGQVPGAALLATYTGELAVHGWDLAHATAQPFSVPDQHLGGAYQAGQFITPEMREDPEVPFEAPTSVDDSASMLDRLAGLMGRPVGRKRAPRVG